MSLLANPASPLTLKDGAGAVIQTVHPSVVDIGHAWHGYRYWLLAEKYTYEDDSTENPYLWGSNDLATWTFQAGPTTANATSDNGLTWDAVGKPSDYSAFSKHNSDGCLHYDAGSDSLWVYFREGRGNSGDATKPEYWFRQTVSNSLVISNPVLT